VERDVISPTAPPHTPGEFVQGLPIGAGFRVPCVVVSPWTDGGWVSSERFDHTSDLRFLEKFTGVHEPNITAWRRKTFGDMTSVFHFHHEHSEPPKLANAHALLRKAHHEFKHLPKVSAPSGPRPMPVQEKRRP
jgi:phospholipase C